MAQIIHDISTPNDGLGDVLRTAFDHQNTMNTDLYTNKVDKVVGKDLSTNDYDNAAVSKLAGIEEGAEVNVQSDWLQDDDTADDYIKNKPEQLFASVGYFDYNDVATQTVPLNFTSGVELQLTNDTLGTFTDRTQAPYNVSNTWDEITNTFDFSELSIGDTLDLRVDLSLTTVGVNAIVKCFLRLGEGTASEYDVFIGSEYFKTAASNDNVKLGLEFYIGSENVRTAPAKLILLSDTNGSVKVNGWYNRIIRRSVNIVDFDDSLLVRKNFFSGYAYDTSGTAIVSPLRPEGQGNYTYTNGSLVSVAGFDTTLLTDLGVIYEGKEIIVQNQTGVNISLLNNGTAELPFIFNTGLDLVIPTGEKIKFKYSGGFLVELFKSWANLEDLSNTNITTPTNGQALTYDTATGKWINSTVSGGSSLRTEKYEWFNGTNTFASTTNWYGARRNVANQLPLPLWSSGESYYDGTTDHVTNVRMPSYIVDFNQKIERLTFTYESISVGFTFRLIYYELNPSGASNQSVNDHLVYEAVIAANVGGIKKQNIYVPVDFTASLNGYFAVVLLNDSGSTLTAPNWQITANAIEVI